MPNIAILGHVWQRHNWTSYPPRSLRVRRYFAFYHVMSLWFVIGRVLNFSLGKTNSRCFVDRFVSFGINRWRFIWMKNVYEHKDKEYAYIMWFATIILTQHTSIVGFHCYFRIPYLYFWRRTRFLRGFLRMTSFCPSFLKINKNVAYSDQGLI